MSKLVDVPTTVRIELVAHGGFAAVYRLAVDPINNIAMKQVKIENKRDEERFCKEVALLSRVLPHPAIVRFLGSNHSHLFGLVHGSIFMEHASGGDLLQKLQDKGPFSEGHVQYCVHQIGSAVAHCHHLGVVHRDIKLDNVVLRGTCVMDGLLLIDFGLAEDIAFTSSDPHAGTTAYRAPVPSNGGVSCPLKADVWSFGILVFALCHGCMPMNEASDLDRRFVTIRAGQRDGLSICDAFHRAAPDMPFRPRLSRHCMQLLNGMLQIEESSRLTSEACANWWL